VRDMSDEAKGPGPMPDDQPDKSMDRRSREDRRRAERREKARPVDPDRRAGADRREGPRRAKRSINQYDMDADVLEFINAINHFKERSGRPFPTWSEVLGILRSLGYEKQN
jgi:hypothetical protein